MFPAKSTRNSPAGGEETGYETCEFHTVRNYWTFARVDALDEERVLCELRGNSNSVRQVNTPIPPIQSREGQSREA